MFYQSTYIDTNGTFCYTTDFGKMSPKEGELLVSKKKNQKTDELGQIIRDLREENGLTREQLSERAALGSRHMAAIESGEKIPAFPH